jgi:hypothetical protein
MDLTIKERARERMELRIHAQETLKTVMEWIKDTNPQNWVPVAAKGEEVVSKDETKALFRDYIDKAGKLTEKVWRPAELLVDDLTKFMEGIVAESKATSENK